MQRIARLTGKYWAELLLLLGSGLVFFYGLGTLRLWDGDEVIYYIVARNINKTHQWIDLFWRYHLNGTLAAFYEKPPLIFWLQALLIRLPGPMEFWFRLPAALAGVGTVMLVYAIGKRLYSKATGVVAAFITLTLPGLVENFHRGQLDGPLIFFIWLALYFSLRLKEHPKFYYFLGATVGLAVMTKGAAGLLIPAILGVTWLWQGKLLPQLRNRHLWQASALAAIIFLPWHIVELMRHGNAFWSTYFGYQLINRIKTPLPLAQGVAPQSILFYTGDLGTSFLPWVFAVPFAVGLALRDTLRGGRRDHHLMLVIILLVFVAFSFSGTKIVWYTLPAYPALAILVADMVVQAFANRRRFIKWLLAGSGVFALFSFPYTFAFRNALLVGLIFGGIWLISNLKLKDRMTAAALTGLMVILAGYVPFYQAYQSSLSYYRSFFLPPARLATVASSGKGIIILYPSDVEILNGWVVADYSNRQVLEAESLGDIVNFTKHNPYDAVVVDYWLPFIYHQFNTKVLAHDGQYSLVRIVKK